MSSPARIDEWASTYVTWLSDTCLPYLVTNGLDKTHGGFVERLSAGGVPDLHSPRTCYGFTRQIYVFALSALRGWYPDGRAIAEEGIAYLLDRWHAPDGAPGFVHKLTPQGDIADPKRDAYDHAFVLFALAWAYQLTRDRQLVNVIQETLAYTDEYLADHELGGWFEDDARTLPRRQNPQMHALEAMLALYDALGDDDMLERARGFTSVFASKLLPRSRVQGGGKGQDRLFEYFDANYAVPAAKSDQVVEAGHHYEWTWLLACLRERDPVHKDAYDYDLIPWVKAHGLTQAGFAYDRCSPEGVPVISSSRLWPQTERVKAHLSQMWEGRSGAADLVCHAAEKVWRGYIESAINGVYVDRLDVHGRIIDDTINVRTFYHIVCMIDELDRVARRVPLIT